MLDFYFFLIGQVILLDALVAMFHFGTFSQIYKKVFVFMFGMVCSEF